MSGSFVILTVFEILAAALLIVGLFKEDALADFEEKAVRVIKRMFRAGRRSKNNRLRYYSKNQKPHQSSKRCA